MRKHFTTDWVFAIKGSITKLVESNHPKDLHSWPLINSFDFTSYNMEDEFIIFILKDKIGRIPAGPSVIDTFNNDSNTLGKPSIENIEEWRKYLYKKYSLRSQDAACIIPLIDSGKDVEGDWNLWPDEFKNLWNIQIELIVNQQFYYKRGVNIMSDYYLPPGYEFLKEECTNFLKDNPDYNKNIFIMTRFVPGNRLLERLDNELTKVLKSHDLNPVRADNKMYMRDRNLWNNVCVYMLCCKFGIAILEDRIADEFNPNVALEYGFMRALNKQTLLLSDSGFRNLRADIIGTLRENFDITDIENTIGAPIERWIKELKG